MKTHRFSPSLWLISVLLVLSARADEAVVLRKLTGEMAADVRTVRAENFAGAVTVVGVTEGFGWEWNLRSSGRITARTEEYAQGCRLEVREVGDALQLIVIRADAEKSRTRRSGPMRTFLSWATLGIVSTDEGEVRSDLTLRVPAAAAVEVKNRFGPVRVSNTRGAANIDCQNGRVDLSDIAAAVTARTSFSSLHAEKIGPARLNNQNGHIEVSDVSGALSATTSFARLKVRQVKGDAALKNQNGAIEATRVTGNLTAATSFSDLRAEEIGGRADLKGQNTRIDAAGISGDVTATTSFGSLHVRESGGSVVLKNQNGKIDATRITGDVIADTSFAEIRIEEIGGRAELNCRNGKIDAARVTGSVRAINSFASLRVRAIGGAVDLRGQNTEIAAAGVTGDIRAETSFGRMQLEGTGRRIEARNQNGAVEIVASSTGVQHIEASATFGPIEVRLPGESKPLIRATTSHGKVRSEFPVLQGDTVSDAKFAADSSLLKVSLKGQNGDIRIQQIVAR
jgi:DUF4097 and DUF4098 domain-containing protein YvlB